MIKVLFVCMGNICRSPTAEGVFRHVLAANNLLHLVAVDSAGTHGYHVGEAPDPRAQEAAIKRGYNIGLLRARQVCSQDFQEFDLILAMDRNNLAALKTLCPPESSTRINLFMEYSSRHVEVEVPDPYYGGAQGFDRVLDMVEDASYGLLSAIRKRSPLANLSA
ncbi:low molecular weight protein-tyrosine-phosphatase [Propionivibrio limicola]|uniref:low molecular weight protein-tyrosine-phosphatase n=1 Tax=Propionivibrio limicola TaxID=167645 RepID=UPI001292BB40|nr:low molecular weight protein-tyrosine-phosphatase [Propionivibrio limicola]